MPLLCRYVSLVNSDFTFSTNRFKALTFALKSDIFKYPAKLARSILPVDCPDIR